MLDNLKKIPRKTRQCLRTNVTRRYPAVPLLTSVMRSAQGHVQDDHENQNGLEEDDDFMDVGDDITYVGMHHIHT